MLIDFLVTFDHPKHGSINLAQYYEKQYDIKLKDPKQPLLISMPKAKDKRAGITEPVKLIPELCLMTGLTDRQRNDFRLMQELSAQLRMDPQQRLTTIRGFGQKMLKADKDAVVLKQWGMSIAAEPVKIGARILCPESIELGPVTQAGDPRRFQYPIHDADWTNSLKDGKYFKLSYIM
jgi:aubergine-like protein